VAPSGSQPGLWCGEGELLQLFKLTNCLLLEWLNKQMTELITELFFSNNCTPHSLSSEREH